MTDSSHAHWADPEAGFTAEDMTDSLTGFEEIAIARAFDAEWSNLAEHKPGMFARCLVYVALVRDAGGVVGATAEAKAACKTQVMEMTMKAAQEFWKPEADDRDPMAGDSGKDAA